MKKNLIFLLKLVTVCILVTAILLSLSAVYKHGLTYQGSNSGMSKYDSVPDQIEYANFGPSYGMKCFRYAPLEAMGKTCFNFSLTMQDLYHDYALYKTYEEHFKNGAVVAIPLSYFSFCSDITAPSGNRYYRILDRKYIKDYTLEKEISAKYIPIYGNGGDLIRDLTNELLDSIMKKYTAAPDTGSAEAAEDHMEEVSLKADSETRVFTIETGNLIPYSDHIEAYETILIRWIEEMAAKGLKPVLLLTPYWHDYAFGFDEALLKTGYHDPVERVIRETGVDYVDFCSEKYAEFIHTPRYFSNCDHVSLEGSEEFMRLYMEYLKEKGLLP
ncbi:MAG: hypothetical protein IKO22_03215 [Oscillospiraceae bacterium]|nr:hypothetical protein [Oscillospiraceae bacterium]